MCDDGRHRISAEADRIETRITAAATGATVLLIVAGTVGTGLALTLGGSLGDARAAYSAGLVAIILAGHMVIAVGALRGHLAIVRFTRSSFEGLHKRLDDFDAYFQKVTDAGGDEVAAQRREGHDGSRI